MAYFIALAAIFLWSTNAFIAKFTLQTIPVEQIQFLQFCGAFLVFYGLRVSKKKLKREPIQLRAAGLGIIGLTGTMIFQYLAFDAGPITQVNIIAYAWPLIAAGIVICVGAAHQPFQLFVLSFVGFIGAILVIAGDNFSDFLNSTMNLGIAAAVASAFCMALFSYGVGRLKIDANDVLLPGCIAGLVITSIWCFLGNSDWQALSPILMGLYLGVGPMGFGYLLWSWAMQRDQSGNISVLGFMTPVSSTGLLLFTGASIDNTALIGAIIVFFCCTAIGLKSWWQHYAT